MFLLSETRARPFVDFQDNEATKKNAELDVDRIQSDKINASYRSMKGDYRALDDSGFFFSIVDDNLRQGCATRSAINTSNDTSPNVFSTMPRCVLPLTLTKPKDHHLPFGRCADSNRMY